MSGDGPFARLLLEVANERSRPSFLVEAYNRALMEPSTDADAYLTAALPHRSRTPTTSQMMTRHMVLTLPTGEQADC